jgi:FtsZ-binding cell division protein ZapB
VDKVNFFYVFCFNVEAGFVENVLGPVYKTQGNCTMTEYGGLIDNATHVGEICFMEAAINKTARSGMFFFQFDNPILEEQILDLFENCGGCHVDVISFRTEADAVEPLKFVLEMQRQGRMSFVFGKISPVLMELMVDTPTLETLETLNQEKRILNVQVDKLLFLALHADGKAPVSTDELKPDEPEEQDDEKPTAISFDELKRDNAILRTENYLLTNENLALKQEKRLLETKANEVKEENAMLWTDNDTLRSQNAELKTNHAMLKADFDKLCGKNVSLRAKLHDFTTRFGADEPAAKRAHT